LFKKINRIISTLKFLRFVQIRYQFFYRIKNFVNYKYSYDKYKNCKLIPIDSNVAYNLIQSKGKYLGNNTFVFLGLEYRFQNEIDWNFSKNGKLWNYNLQYLDFILDESIPVNERTNFLICISEKLLNYQLKLEPYPVSLRIVNSLFFVSKNNIKEEIITKAILFQIAYLEENLEYHLLANHLLENYLSLYISSLAINDFKLTKTFQKKLKQELEIQILQDGAHYECSPMYHSIILSKIFICLDLAITNGNDLVFTNYLKKKATKMLNWINAYSFPDGSWALMNDSALGIAPKTSDLNFYSDFFALKKENILLKESGFRKISGSNWECIIKCGNIQPSYQPGHTHSDILNFCLWYKGKHLIVDQGVSTYNNTENRNFERSTKAHNTVTVNDLNQSDVWDSFRIGKRAIFSLIEDSPSKVVGKVAFHNDFFTHFREFLKTDNNLIISDMVEGITKTDIEYKTRFLFGVPFEWVENDSMLFYENVSLCYQGTAKYNKVFYSSEFNNFDTGYLLEITNTKPQSVIFKFL
jgi:hypothetical protein